MYGEFWVTTLPRTILDMARTLEPGSLSAVVDDAIVRGLISPSRLENALACRRTRNIAATVAVNQCLAPWLDGGRAPDSVPEVQFVRLLERSGFEPPARQFPIRDGDDFIAFVDFAWPARRVIVEVDGFRYHATPSAHEKDKRRANRIRALGWVVIDTTPTELAQSPEHVLNSLRGYGLGASRS
jgi:hypothetical protein